MSLSLSRDSRRGNDNVLAPVKIDTVALLGDENSTGQNAVVAKVARKYGFAHMARFSGEYRDYFDFGEHPSETLEKRLRS